MRAVQNYQVFGQTLSIVDHALARDAHNNVTVLFWQIDREVDATIPRTHLLLASARNGPDLDSDTP